MDQEPDLSGEFDPTREVLQDIRDQLVRLQYECEDMGWWPGSGETSYAQSSTPAPGTLYVLGMILRDAEPQHDGANFKGSFEEFLQLPRWPVKGWPSFWAHEIRRVLISLDGATSELLEHWDDFICMIGETVGIRDDDSGEWGWEIGALEFPLTDELAKLVVPDYIAVHLNLCRRRLETVLRDGPQDRDLFIPTPVQAKILEAIEHRAMTLESLAAELRIDKSTLHRTDLKRLLKLGKVVNDRKLGGYYRPDAPPE